MTSKDICYWCAGGPATERDHVFQSSLFAKPRPPLITVPACSQHNRLFSLDEEYFRDFILSGSYTHPEGQRLWSHKTRPTLRLKPSYRAMLARSIRKVEVRTAAGFFLGTLDQVVGDAARIDRVLRKTIRGLYYHLYKEALGPVSFTVRQVFRVSDVPDELRRLIRGLRNQGRVGHVRYWFGRAADEHGVTLGMIGYFDRSAFILIGEPSDRDDRILVPHGRTRGFWIPRESGSA